MSGTRVAILVVAIIATAIMAAVLWDAQRATCDEFQLKEALSEIEGTPPAKRASVAANAIIAHCPRPASEVMDSHISYIATFFDDIPTMRVTEMWDPRIEALWDELCSSNSINEDSSPDLIYESCKLARFDVLTLDEGRTISPYTTRTWTFYPWLLHNGASRDTTRRFLRALLLWPWQKRCPILDAVALPHSSGFPFSPLSPAADIVLVGDSLYDCLEPLGTVNEANWKRVISDLHHHPHHYRLFAAASTSAVSLAAVLEEVTRHGSTISLIVATNAPYQPYAELPLEYGEHDAPRTTLRISLGMTVRDLARYATELMGQPCCATHMVPTCPRLCVEERISVVHDVDDGKDGELRRTGVVRESQQ
jgi:hypothetical protein